MNIVNHSVLGCGFHAVQKFDLPNTTKGMEANCKPLIRAIRRMHRVEVHPQHIINTAESIVSMHSTIMTV